MRDSIQETLISVWRQALVEKSTFVQLGNKKFRVKKTFRAGLTQVNFVCEGEEVRGIEQDPESKCRWAQMAREGKLVMQFLFGGAHVPNVTDGVFTAYSGPSTHRDRTRIPRPPSNAAI
jgi:hypothetical protein